MTGVLLETQQISTDCQLIVVLVLVAGLGIGFEDSGSPGSSDLEVGLKGGGGSTGIVGNTPNELEGLAKREGHRFSVRQIASAGMKDGSVTFALGSVNINVGARCRFFVRDGDFSKKEVCDFIQAYFFNLDVLQIIQIYLLFNEPAGGGVVDGL